MKKLVLLFLLSLVSFSFAMKRSFDSLSSDYISKEEKSDSKVDPDNCLASKIPSLKDLCAESLLNTLFNLINDEDLLVEQINITQDPVADVVKKEIGNKINRILNSEGETYLLKAIKNRCINRLKFLLYFLKANPNLADADGASPVFYAIRHMPIAISHLIKAGADINFKDNEGWTPLMFATQFSGDKFNPEVFDELIAANADVNIKDEFNATALEFAIRHNPILVNRLLRIGANVNVQSSDNKPLLLLALECKLNKFIIGQLLEKVNDVKITDAFGRDALMYACEYSPECIEMFIKAGCGVHNRDSEDRTALMYASRFHSSIIEVLLANGSEINAVDSVGMTPLMYAATFNPSSIEILIKNNADVNVSDYDGDTALHNASRCNPNTIPLLIEAGAHVNVKNNLGRTPLMIVSKHAEKFIAYLIQKGAKIEARDGQGATALMYASKNKPKAIYLLLKYGAKHDVIDRNGLIAYNYSDRMQNKECKNAWELLFINILNKSNEEFKEILFGTLFGDLYE